MNDRKPGGRQLASSTRTRVETGGAMPQPAPDPDEFALFRPQRPDVGDRVLGRQIPPQRRETLRRLRSELAMRQAAPVDGLAAVIVVISPSAGEGRSQVCADLATVISETGARTLLVDGDFRSPSLHQQFGVPRDLGLAEAIADDKAPLLHGMDGHRSFFLMTAGRAVEDPLERLSNPMLRQMLQKWRSELDFIIIDTPPGSKYLDALVLSTLATQVLMVGRQDHTSTELTEKLLKRLSRLDIPVTGAVMNRF